MATCRYCGNKSQSNKNICTNCETKQIIIHLFWGKSCVKYHGKIIVKNGVRV